MISFFTEDISKPLKIGYKSSIKKWIIEVAEYHKIKCGDINVIFCSDKYLLDINIKFLNHNYLTDIITFNYNTDSIISGDIFISIETVAENALHYNVSFDNELNRVIIHGILHLIGFNDETDEQLKEMKHQENVALEMFH